MLLDMLSVISALINLFGCTLKCHTYFSVATAAMLMMVVIPVPKPSRAERSKRNTGLSLDRHASGHKTVAIVSSYLCLFI